MGTESVCMGYKRPLGSCCGSAPLRRSDSHWLGTQPPPTPPLPPSPQVRLPVGICLDWLKLGVVDGVMVVGSGCHAAGHTHFSNP